MTAAGAAKGAGVLGVGAGGLVAVALSPMPLLMLGAMAMAVLVLGTVAVVVLTATLSCHPTRQANAAAVLDRLLAAVTRNRWPSEHPAPCPALPESQAAPEPSALPAAASPRGRRRHR